MSGGQPHYGPRDDHDACKEEERSFGERGEMLRLAVPVLVPLIRRPHRDADREERQERGDEVGAGVDRLRDEPEAVGREARPELERDERARGEDGCERGAPLRAHPQKRIRPATRSTRRASPAWPATLPASLRLEPARAAR